MGWSVEWGSAGGGALTNLENSFPLYFVKRLNGVGMHSCLINDPSSKPQTGELVRFVWDRGNSGETTHFEGFITDVRRVQETNSFLCRGLSLEGLFWESTTGALRKYRSTSPFNILTQTGSPNGLIFNSQGNRKPIGSTTLQYGADNTKPNQIDSDTTGDSLDFRTDSGKTWLNLQRLFLQARATGDYPSWVSAGDDFGLEGYVELTTSENDEPRLFVVTRREPSVDASPTTITYPTGFQDFKRGSEGLTARNAINVVGAGAGQQRTESGFVGSGGIEGIVTDKTVLDSTGASNQANRLQTLLDPDTDVITTVTGEHYRDWVPGHRYTLEFPNTTNVTQRLFTVGYVLREESFKLVFGRPRPLPNDPFRSVQNLAGGHAQGTQIMDGVKTESSMPRSSTATLSDGGTDSVSLQFDNTVFDADFHEALVFWVDINTSNTGDTDDDQATLDIDLTVGGSTNHVHRERKNTTEGAGTSVGAKLEYPLYFVAEFLRGASGLSGEISSATLTVTNRSGVDRDVSSQLWGWVQA